MPKRALAPTPHELWDSNLLQFNIPVRIIDKRLPRLVFFLRELEIQERAPSRFLRLADQCQVGLPWCSAALSDITVHTGTDDIIPGGTTSLAPGNDVVEAQFTGRKLLAAILALVVIAGEDIPPVEFHGLLRQLIVPE